MLSEAEGCDILHAVFRARGHQTRANVVFAEEGVEFDADGWDPVARRLEEIKTSRGDLTHQPDNHRQLHWAQARVYGALICRLAWSAASCSS